MTMYGLQSGVEKTLKTDGTYEIKTIQKEET